MNVLLVDVDKSRFPNLALMKLSAWHKQRGDNVFLNRTKRSVDKIYISVVFNWNRDRALQLFHAYRSLNYDVKIGGYPVNSDLLEPQIEHIQPDYDLYGVDYSMGFTSRGCIRACEFCIVYAKEGPIHPVAEISEFLHPDHEKLLLLDNNLLASPKWEDVLTDIRERDVAVDFNQGLDIRLIDERRAEALSSVKLLQFLRFSFDNVASEAPFRKGMKKLLAAGVKPRDISVYVLVGFNTTFREDMKRFRILKSFKVNAYPMIYRPPAGRSEGVRPKGDIKIMKKSIGLIPRTSIYTLAKFYGVYEDQKDLHDEFQTTFDKDWREEKCEISEQRSQQPTAAP